jgi:hypothetical protein
MKLIELLNGIDHFDNEQAIFVPINSEPSEDSEAIISSLIIIESELPSLDVPKGMKFLLDVETVKEIIQVWRDWNNEKEPSPMDKYQAVLYYVENDAYLAENEVSSI